MGASWSSFRIRDQGVYEGSRHSSANVLHPSRTSTRQREPRVTPQVTALHSAVRLPGQLAS